VAEIAPGIWRGFARFGFLQRPDIPALLAEAHATGCGIDPTDLTYFVGHETVVAREDGPGLPHWVEAMFAFMQRNSLHVTDYFRLPPEIVVELGREIAI
jgi:KUP system potassium uptake protein